MLDRATFDAVMVAYRPEEIPDNSAAGVFLADLEHSAHPLQVRLAPLSAAAIAGWCPTRHSPR